MRPPTTYSTPSAPPRQEGLSKRNFQNDIAVTCDVVITTWKRFRRLTASEALCRAGATLGNWNDRVRGEHQVVVVDGQRHFERSRAWHVVDRIAVWLYVAPERRAR